ncbi:MAG: hypothetical protein M3380_04335, partial [Chloroflexota bacterium]|nr:hypothetical protein [Chloroflexota bacterium]
HAVAVQLLHGSIAYGLHRYDDASCAVQQALRALEHSGKPMELARACLLQAQIAAGATSAASDVLIASLDRAAQVGDQLGHDAFLVAETMHMGNMLRRAYATGWSRAADWMQRQQEMLAVAQSLQHDRAEPLLVVRALGLDQIMLNGQPVEIGWLKAREVFFYLLAHPNGATPEALSEAIWPDLGRDSGRNALKAAVYQLRSALPRELIALRGRQLYVLNRDAAQIDYDVERFLAILDTPTADPEALFEVLDLYRGPYLPWSDNEWSNNLRLDLEQHYLHALRISAERCEQAGGYLDALNLYRRLLTIDTLDEAAHAGVMRCQIALGNRAAAISQYQALRRMLDEELGLELGSASEVEQLYHHILATS